MAIPLARAARWTLGEIGAGCRRWWDEIVCHRGWLSASATITFFGAFSVAAVWLAFPRWPGYTFAVLAVLALILFIARQDVTVRRRPAIPASHGEGRRGRGEGCASQARTADLLNRTRTVEPYVPAAPELPLPPWPGVDRTGVALAFNPATGDVVLYGYDQSVRVRATRSRRGEGVTVKAEARIDLVERRKGFEVHDGVQPHSGKQSGLVDHAVWGGIQGLADRASRMASMGRRPWLRALTR